MGYTQPYEHERMLEGIKLLVGAGLVGHVVLSQDVCWRTDYVAYGGRGYAFVSTGLREELRALGVGDEPYHRMTVDNPRRALTGEPGRALARGPGSRGTPARRTARSTT